MDRAERLPDAGRSHSWYTRARLWIPASLLLAAAITKAADPAAPAETLGQLGLFGGWIVPAVVATVVAESAVGAWLFFIGSERLVRRAGVGLFVALTCVLLVILASKNPPTCHCLGRIRVFDSARHEAMFGIARNVAMVALLAWPIRR